MIHSLLFVLYFFAPVGLANMAPPILAKIKFLKPYDYPMDFYRKFRGKPVFGDHKTWRGFIGGIIIAILTLWLEVYIFNYSHFIRSLMPSYINYDHFPILWLGFLFGAGALLGDAIESFFKRQFQISAGESLAFFDQTDYIIGAILTSLLVIRLDFVDYILLIIVFFALHIIFSFIGYLIKVKSSPL